MLLLHYEHQDVSPHANRGNYLFQVDWSTWLYQLHFQ